MKGTRQEKSEPKQSIESRIHTKNVKTMKNIYYTIIILKTRDETEILEILCSSLRMINKKKLCWIENEWETINELLLSRMSEQEIFHQIRVSSPFFFHRLDFGSQVSNDVIFFNKNWSKNWIWNANIKSSLFNQMLNSWKVQNVHDSVLIENLLIICSNFISTVSHTLHSCCSNFNLFMNNSLAIFYCHDSPFILVKFSSFLESFFSILFSIDELRKLRRFFKFDTRKWREKLTKGNGWKLLPCENVFNWFIHNL